MKKYLDASMSFAEYEALIERLAEEGKTTGPKQSVSLANFTRLNLHRMNRLAKTFELEDAVKSTVRQDGRKKIWLTITEAWCGDAAQNIPIIEKIAAENDNIKTRYILRDEHPELIDRFLTFGARSIPKVIALDADTLEILWTWGARPTAVQDLFFQLRDRGIEKPLIIEQVQRWYNEDRGVSIQLEFSELIRGVEGRKTAEAAR